MTEPEGSWAPGRPEGGGIPTGPCGAHRIWAEGGETVGGASAGGCTI